MEQRFKKEGLHYEPVDGNYGQDEQSYIVYNPSLDQMHSIGKDFGQESVVYGENGNHQIHYTTGPNVGHYHPTVAGQNINYFATKPKNYWTEIPGSRGFFNINVDWNTKHPVQPPPKKDAMIVKKHYDIAADLQKSWPKDEAENQANTQAHNQLHARARRQGHEVVDAAALVAPPKISTVLENRVFQREFWESLNAAAPGGLVKTDPAPDGFALVPIHLVVPPEGKDGNHPDSILPGDKKSKKIKSQDDNKIKDNSKAAASNKEKRKDAADQSDNYFWTDLMQGITAGPLAKNLPLAQAPALHNTVEGFMGGLKSLPKGSPARGKLITQHMNHAPFLTALNAHPQGKQVHAMLMTHLNSQANAGFKPGASVAMAKAWPKDEAENQENIAHHLVRQDHAQESGKVLTHTNAKMSQKGEKLKFATPTGTRLNHGYAEAQGANSAVRVAHLQSILPDLRHGTIEPHPHPRDEEGFWSDVSADAEVYRGNDRSDGPIKDRETYKNRFPTGGDFSHIFAHLTGLKKSWPKDEAENQANINAHLVTQDHLQEKGKPLRHNTAKLAAQGEKLKFVGPDVADHPDRLKLNPGYAEAQGSNSKARVEHINSVQPYSRTGVIEPWPSKHDHDDFWGDTSRDAGIEPDMGLADKPSPHALKRIDAHKNVFDDPSQHSFEHIFAHLTGNKKA